jgi:DNA (cytosine-5)-methyltransferase 1
MAGPRYISLFSGMGGLEHPTMEPLLFCDSDPACQEVLRSRHPTTPIRPDAKGLTRVPKAEFVVGGWPCQDLSIAGKQSGIGGNRSALFFEMLRIAIAAKAHTLIGENVPNLLGMRRGEDFRRVLSTVTDAGYRYVGWRVLNARAFGIPQERRRLFIVASRHLEYAWAIHHSVPPTEWEEPKRQAYGFYWTAGARSLCFSKGYVPALKIGASDEKGRAPVAVLVDGRVRKLSTQECLRLQGFNPLQMQLDRPSSAVLRMAGNAVALPVGRFVMKAVTSALPGMGTKVGFGIVTDAGLYDDGIIWEVDHDTVPLAANLGDYLDESGEELTPQACAGLIVRSIRSGHNMPRELFDVLVERSKDRSRRLQPSRANSFEALDSMTADIERYRARLQPISATQSYQESVWT